MTSPGEGGREVKKSPWKRWLLLFQITNSIVLWWQGTIIHSPFVYTRIWSHLQRGAEFFRTFNPYVDWNKTIKNRQPCSKSGKISCFLFPVQFYFFTNLSRSNTQHLPGGGGVWPKYSSLLIGATKVDLSLCGWTFKWGLEEIRERITFQRWKPQGSILVFAYLITHFFYKNQIIFLAPLDS